MRAIAKVANWAQMSLSQPRRRDQTTSRPPASPTETHMNSDTTSVRKANHSQSAGCGSTRAEANATAASSVASAIPSENPLSTDRAFRTRSGTRSSSMSVSMRATSVGATTAAKHTASHHGRTGNNSAAVSAPSINVSGMPMTISRKLSSPRRITRPISSRDA